ncbi:MAG: cytochrome c [Pseudomonadota bacterium]
MTKVISVLAIATLSFNMNIAIAADAAAGKVRAATCAACHGVNGISANDMWPNLAGQKNGYLIAQMKAFRDGIRKNPVMSPMAASLTDTDIANLAAYYSGLGG